MTVIEKITEINNILKEIFNFTQTNETIKEDFTEYLSTIGANNISLNQMEKIFLPYIFERRINDKSILEMFKESSKNSDIIDGLINAQSSVFEIKKILKSGFELYNLINERTYTVSSLTKMTNFRGVYAGQYIVARIFSLAGDYYVIETKKPKIINVKPYYDKYAKERGYDIIVHLPDMNMINLYYKPLDPGSDLYILKPEFAPVKCEVDYKKRYYNAHD
jgi:hypothetical protein